MRNKITKSPQIRFAGFSDDWEQWKAEEIFKTVSDKGHPELPVLSASQQLGMVRRDENGIDIQYDIKSLVNYKRVLPKQFVIHLRSFQGGFAHSSLEGITSPAYTIIDFKSENIQSDLFWNEIFTSKKFIKKLETVTYGIRDGRSISFNDFKTLLFTLPSYKEQEQIAGFFNDLNNLIALHQRELELLKDTKKSLLQKMFPKDGANVPEIRFAGFTDAWEQRKLRELADIVRGASPRPIQDPKWFDDKSDIGWLRIADVTEQDGRIYYLEQRISKAGQQKTRVLTEPHLLLSIAATVGKPVVNYVKTGVHDGFLIFQNPKFDREFMFQWLESFRPNWQKYGQPGSQVNLNSDLVKNQEIMLPSTDEQLKIGDFFKSLDNLITLHQRELNSLKDLKKSLLQQMFV